MTEQQLLTDICKATGVTQDAIKSNNRKKEAVAARHIYMYLLRTKFKHKLRDIAEYLGDRREDHTKIIKACHNIKGYIKINDPYIMDILVKMCKLDIFYVDYLSINMQLVYPHPLITSLHGITWGRIVPV